MQMVYLYMCVLCFQNFFGLLRFNGGLNNHPNASQFAYLYRLMSVYSLIKPPKGSNVTGGKLLESSLLNSSFANLHKDNKKGKTKQEIMKILSAAIEDCSFDPNEEIQLTASELGSVVETQMAGYVAKTAKDRWCKSCPDCHKSVATANPRDLPCYNLIKNRSYGYLTYPTEILIKFICSLENIILPILKAGLSSKTLNKVLTALVGLSVAEKLPLIGCKEHHLLLTQQLIYFYSTTRMYFASRVERLHSVSIAKAKSDAKQKKLIVSRPNARKKYKSASQAHNFSKNHPAQLMTNGAPTLAQQPPPPTSEYVFIINMQ
jgi:hypothetical protein